MYGEDTPGRSSGSAFGWERKLIRKRRGSRVFFLSHYLRTSSIFSDRVPSGFNRNWWLGAPASGHHSHSKNRFIVGLAVKRYWELGRTEEAVWWCDRCQMEKAQKMSKWQNGTAAFWTWCEEVPHHSQRKIRCAAHANAHCIPIARKWEIGWVNGRQSEKEKRESGEMKLQFSFCTYLY